MAVEMTRREGGGIKEGRWQEVEEHRKRTIEAKEKEGKEQVARGHNIVADGWAGASNSYPHPTPP